MEEDNIENIIEDLNSLTDLFQHNENITINKSASILFRKTANLLKRYKELEEENESLVRQYEHQGALMVNEYFSKEQVFKHFIPISVIQNKIDEITKYRDLAKELIEERVVIADSDSLNYGRAEAHDKDIQVLQKLLEERE